MLTKRMVAMVLAMVVACGAARGETVKFRLQSRDRQTGHVQMVEREIDPAKTGVVVIDMWNYHWCKTATERVGALVPRMERCLRAARQLGMQVFYAPTDAVDAYLGTPQRERVLVMPLEPLPALKEITCPKPPQGPGCACGREKCGGNFGWDGMHPDLSIAEADLMPNSFEQLYTLCKSRGIEHLLFLGVHTQVCLLHKSVGMMNMKRAGFDCILARDLTDAHPDYDPAKGVTPDDLTARTVAHFERYLCSSVQLYDELKRLGHIQCSDPVDPVRLAPWGTVQRPHLFEQDVIVTVSTPWQAGATIRYTTDGTAPTATSTVYSEPLTFEDTTLVRAQAFKDGRAVCIETTGYFAKLGAKPPLPDVYLGDVRPYRTTGPGHSPSDARHRWAPFVRGPQKDRNNRGQPLVLRGQTYKRGMGVHAPNAMMFRVKEEYDRFVAEVGMDEEMLRTSRGSNLAMYPSAVFRVFIDGEEAAASPVMRITFIPWRFDVKIPRGAKIISLCVTDAGNGNKGDWADWVNAGFVLRKSVEMDPDKVDMRWWYREPAEKFWEGLAIGTGRFAAMVYGRTSEEVIPFNDETLWAGSPYNPVNPNGPKALPEIRKEIFAGHYGKAQGMCRQLSSYPRKEVQNYQAMGRLRLYFDGHENVEDYRRELNMDTATAKIQYRIGETTYEREVFASYPDQVVVHRIKGSKPGQVSMKVRLDSIQASATSRILSETTLAMEGGTIKAGPIPNLMRWQAQVQVKAKGGQVGPSQVDKGNPKTQSCIEVRNADEVVLVLAGATNFVSWNDISADPAARCRKYMKAAQQDYATLRQRHLEDYQPRFRRCRLFVGANDAAAQDTTTRLNNMREKGVADPHFVNQYFQYARYLLLAASREGTLAFNNHNIWLDDLKGRWAGRWTLNINIQECFWPVETTNLPEVNESMHLFLKMLSASGQRTAKQLYGCRGWCAHHGTDVWMNTAPTDNPRCGMSPTMGAWLCQSLWEHYLFDPDPSYLKDIYPLLKGSALFCLDFLVTEPKSGYLVTCPSISSENDFRTPKGQQAAVSLASTMDISLIRDNFAMVIQAARQLGVDEGLCSELEQAAKRLPPYQIGSWGQLQEWFYDWDRPEDTHRHLSHMVGFHPGNQIQLERDPELAAALRKSLEHRGDDKRGWSGSWKVNLWARFGEAERAHKILTKMMTDVSLHAFEEDSNRVPSMEGNQAIQGWAAGLAEMLLQSHTGEVVLLPALPKAWPDGQVKGLRARGGFEIDMTWQDGQLKQATIHSKYKKNCAIRYNDTRVTIPFQSSSAVRINGALELIEPR